MVFKGLQKTVAVSGRFLLFNGEKNGSGCCLSGHSAGCIPGGIQTHQEHGAHFRGHIQITNVVRDCLSAPERIGQNGASAATVLPIFLRSLASSVVGFRVQSRILRPFRKREGIRTPEMQHLRFQQHVIRTDPATLRGIRKPLPWAEVAVISVQRFCKNCALYLRS